jgi:hypothetical protein
MIKAINGYRTRTGRHDAADHANQRCFAGAVWAQQGKDLALPDFKIDVC